MKKFVIAAMMMLLSSPVLAGTAICRNIIGATVNQKSDLTLQNDKDGYDDAIWVFHWSASGEGTVITEPSHAASDTSPISATAVVIHGRAFVSMIVMYPKAMFTFSLYPDGKKMLVSVHSDSELVPYDASGKRRVLLSGSILTGTCTFE